MLHFIARKFARASSKVCPDEGSDCPQSTSKIAQLKNSSSVCAVLLDSNKWHLKSHRHEYILLQLSCFDHLFEFVVKDEIQRVVSCVYTRMLLMIVSNVFKIASSSSF